VGFGTKFSNQDVIEALQTLHYDLALATRRGQLLALRDLALTDTVVLGFDYPFAEESTIEPAKRELSAFGVFDEGELRRVARDNSLKILPGLSSRIGQTLEKVGA
jgi:hypothetical protein